MRLGRAGEPGQRRRQHEGEQLVAIGVVAERDRARLVLADRLQHLAERRMDDAVDEQEAGDEDRQHDVVHAPDVVDRSSSAEELAARHRLDAVLAAGERRLQAEEVHHLRQRQRDHREVDALAADRQQPGDDAQQRRGRRAQQDRELRRQAPDLRGVRADVAGHAEEHRMAERQQADEADQQVERAGEQREAQHLHQEHRIDAEQGATRTAPPSHARRRASPRSKRDAAARTRRRLVMLSLAGRTGRRA